MTTQAASQGPRFAVWLKTRPYKLVDAINRMAAATGSVRGAMAASSADYNGHGVAVSFNDFRKYWVAQYYWGQRVVLNRGDLEGCVRAAAREYNRGALGSEVVVTLRDQNEVDLVLGLGLGFEAYSEEIKKEHEATWKDDRFAEVPYALRDRTTHLLIQAKDLHEYKALRDEERNKWRKPAA